MEEFDNDDEYENEFLKIEEDGDDGLLLAEIIDGNDSEEATVNLERFFIDNMDDKLDIQYYEGIKFEGEGVGEGLNDEAVVVDLDDDIKDEKKDEEKGEIKEEKKIEEQIKEVKEENKEVKEVKKEEKKEVKKEIWLGRRRIFHGRNGLL